MALAVDRRGACAIRRYDWPLTAPVEPVWAGWGQPGWGQADPPYCEPHCMHETSTPSEFVHPQLVADSVPSRFPFRIE